MAYMFAVTFGGNSGFAEPSHPLCGLLFGAGGLLLLIGFVLVIRPDLLRH